MQNLSKTKILFLIQNLEIGGAETVLVNFVNQLAKTDRFEITVQTISSGGLLVSQLSTSISFHALNFYPSKLFTKAYKRHFFQVIKGYTKFIIFCRLLSPSFIYNKFINKNYDIEIAFLEGDATRFLGTKGNACPRTIAWIHTNLNKYFYIRWLFIRKKNFIDMFNRFDSIFCVSETTKEGFLTRFPNVNAPISVFHNLIDYRKIKEKLAEASSKSWQPDSDYPVVLSVGRLNEVKQFSLLVRIHASLISKGIYHKLWIVGEGPDRHNIEREIIHSNVTDTVTLWGQQANPFSFFAKASIYVCASKVEGFSQSVCEAVIANLPILSIDCGGLREILGSPPCGIIVETFENFEKELFRLLTSQELRNTMSLASARRSLNFASDTSLENAVFRITGVINEKNQSN